MRFNKDDLLSWPLYPILLGLYIPLNYFAHNQSLYVFSDAIRSFAIIPVLVGLLLSILWLVFRRVHFAAITTTLIVGYTVYFRIQLANEILFVLVILGATWLLGRQRIGPNCSRILNVLMLVVIIQPVIAIGTFTQAMQFEHVDSMDSSPFSNIKIEKPQDLSSLPTIVHIVLDGYASNDTLLDIFKFDNTPFTDELKQLGFVVAQNVRTPYNQTLLSMSSIFSGSYLQSEQGALNEEDADLLRGSLGLMVTQGPMQQRLNELDYQYLAVETGYNFLPYPDFSTLSGPNFKPEGKNPYETNLLIFLDILPREPESGPVASNSYLRHAFTTDFYRKQETPFLLHEHILAPHPPFNIDRDGNDTQQWPNFNTMADGSHGNKGEPALIEEYKQGYLEKLRYANGALVKHVKKMIQDIPGPKIIMVHGDHGSGAYYNQEEIEKSCLSERYNTFLAVYADDPAVRKQLVSLESEPFNLINLYRLIFDINFGTDMGQLENRSFFASWKTPQQLTPLKEEQITAACNNQQNKPVLSPAQLASIPD
jgi:hypothetical protein